METWQLKHIHKHLSELIHTTDCNDGLKASLISAKVINLEEKQNLSTTRHNFGSISEAGKLYDILVTRKHGFFGIYKALRSTCQSGALSIFRDGMAEQLHNIPLQISWRKVPFTEVFPDYSVARSRRLLENMELEEELIDIFMQQSSCINFDVWDPPTRPLYISRSISNRLFLEPKVFQMDCPDVFVFKGITERDIVKLAGFNVTRSSSTQTSGITCRHVYLEQDEDFDYMVLASEAPIHVVMKEYDKYVLQRSSKVTDVILKNSNNKGRHKEAYTPEDQFILQLLSQFSSTLTKGALLCDVPGMGKTWLMESLAKKYKTLAGNEFVFFVGLAQLSVSLSSMSMVLSRDDALMFILKHATQSNLLPRLLLHPSNITSHRFVLFLDGFDEIAPTLVDHVTSVLRNLVTFENIRLVISSRPHMREHLERIFKLIAYDILPFTIEEQVNTLQRYWQLKFQEAPTSGLLQFAHQCVKSVNGILREGGPNILGVPLQCFILATVNEKTAQQIVDSQRNKKCFKIDSTATVTSIFMLYERFVQCSFQRIEDSQRNYQENLPVCNDQLVIYHTYKALDLLFPEFAPVYSNTYNVKMMQIDPRIIRDVGIMGHPSNEFIHRTFAEYLVAKFFLRFWSNVGTFEHGFIKVAGILFVDKILGITWDKVAIRDIYASLRFDAEPIINDQKLCQVRFGTLLWFMNNCFKAYYTGQSQAAVASLTPVYSSVATLGYLQDALKRNIYFLLIGLAKNGFVFLLRLMADIVHAFLTEADIATLMLFDTWSNIFDEVKPRPKPQASVPFLIFSVATTGSPEALHAIFKIFRTPSENFLLDFCLTSFPNDFNSPLELAVFQNNYDMFINCTQLINVPWQRLFLICLKLDKISESALEAKERIFANVISSDPTKNCRITTDDFTKYWQSFQDESTSESNNIFLNFVLQHEILLHHLPRYLKRQLVGETIRLRSDSDFVTLLLLMFDKTADEGIHASCINLKIGESLSATSTKVIRFKAEVLLQYMDKNEARKLMSELRLNSKYAFKSIRDLRTLKLLIGCCKDFSICNEQKGNYMHCAVAQGNATWVDYLINTGYNPSETDKDGNTPLLMISTKFPIDITKVFLRHRANIYAVNGRQKNVAHMLFHNCARSDFTGVYGWVDLMLSHGHRALWDMRDNLGKTPLQCFSMVVVNESIIQKITDERYKKLLFAVNPDFHLNISKYSHLPQFNIPYIVNLVFKLSVSLINLSTAAKKVILKASLVQDNDEEFVICLLLLFPNYSDQNSLSIDVASGSIAQKKSEDMNVFKSEIILSMLNLVQAREAFPSITNPCYFRNFRSLETLKLLTALALEFSTGKNKSYSFMDLSARSGNCKWMEYLIQAGHDVNQEDEDGETPLHRISPKHAFNITRLLVANGANLYAVNKDGSNCAHLLLSLNGTFEKREISENIDCICEWVMYTLDNGFASLWSTMNGDNRTPLELLKVMVGNDHKIVQAVMSYLDSTTNDD